jgi:hypothetical protein
MITMLQEQIQKQPPIINNTTTTTIIIMINNPMILIQLLTLNATVMGLMARS